MLPRMLEISRAHSGASVIAVIRVLPDQVSRFGIIAGTAIADDVWQVSGLVEKPPTDQAPSDLAIFGRYLLSPAVMRIIEHTAPGAGGEIQLTDALVELLATEEMYALIVDPTEGLDVGTIPDWITANNRLFLPEEDAC
jgi:UTP--glucose-1-phosphate uridylyltransferase